MRRAVLAVLALTACAKRDPGTNLDLELIRISEQPRLRTDKVGLGRFTDTATFVLVDAENTASQGAHVTLAGDLVDAAGAVIGHLNAQSLWIPARESRTFALVDAERRPRPSTTGVNIKVRGAMVPKQPPIVHVEELRSFDDHGKIVVQGYLVNEADRIGQVTVIGAFHDERGRPMTRPFQVVQIGPRSAGMAPGECPDIEAREVTGPLTARCTVQFVGPEGSKRGTIFVGQLNY